MTISRRSFLKGGLGLLSLYLTPAELLAFGAQSAGADPLGEKSNILVIVQLNGGNDGLNTVVPYGVGAYYDARPNLAVPEKDVLALNNSLGLHPAMKGMADLYKDGKLAIFQSVGYANPNRSHFRSIEIWQTGQPERISDTGWLGRYLDYSCPAGETAKNLMAAVNVDPTLPKTLLASKINVPSVNNVYDFRFRTDAQYAADRKAQVEAFSDIYSDFSLRRPYVELLRETGLEANKASDYLLKIVRSYKGTAKYPNGKLGDGLKFIAQMICGGVNSRIYSVSLDGFDTHANQLRGQPPLLRQLSEALTVFQNDLQLHDKDKQVLTLVFSEFGRRVAENGGKGTDHGTAEPLFVIGSGIKGGVYGEPASLTNLDNGDLKYTMDFRDIYATILDRWMAADSSQILGRKFDTVPFV